MPDRTKPWDTYRVLPHRDVLDCSLYSAATGEAIRESYEHVPCGMDLKRRDIEDNRCPHCDAGHRTINKAAKKRAEGGDDR